ncbi:hypothetical protein EDC01DRAFT_633112 [Geopyxis carbonaria]|nr:hypothetical protein EDC01DRAFT_633112 [Geopyxis carbonaria]
MPSGDSPIAIASPSPSVGVGSPCPTLAPRASPALMSAPTEVGASISPGIITHKEWVVPPRPKPGRKPATDTPPTKRKAQNRAAQRAFRERRAARVNELEDKLKDINDETTARDQGFKDQIQQLSATNAELVKENAAYKTQVENLKRELEELQRLKTEYPSNFVTQVASPAPSADTDAPCVTDYACSDVIDKAPCDRPSVMALPPRRSDRSKPKETTEPTVMGCGGCSKDGECACYNQATASLPKRSTSPSLNIPPKRSRTAYLDDLETDFTTAYMSKSHTNMAQVLDPCGFCSDGTPCVCAEVANAMDMEDSDTDEESSHKNIKLAPMLGTLLTPPSSSSGESVPKRSLDKLTPLHPPHTIKSTPKPATSSGCKPGGCDQCKSDPMSTLFCQSVNTMMKKNGANGGCCGGGECGDIEGRPTRSRTAKKSTPKKDDGKTYIPCSAAYQTISRHRAFDEATADLGSLVRPLIVQGGDGRCPEVEVSSVRDVLKMLDRRFGRD